MLIATLIKSSVIEGYPDVSDWLNDEVLPMKLVLYSAFDPIGFKLIGYTPENNKSLPVLYNIYSNDILAKYIIYRILTVDYHKISIGFNEFVQKCTVEYKNIVVDNNDKLKDTEFSVLWDTYAEYHPAYDPTKGTYYEFDFNIHLSIPDPDPSFDISGHGYGFLGKNGIFYYFNNDVSLSLVLMFLTMGVYGYDNKVLSADEIVQNMKTTIYMSVKDYYESQGKDVSPVVDVSISNVKVHSSFGSSVSPLVEEVKEFGSAVFTNVLLSIITGAIVGAILSMLKD